MTADQKEMGKQTKGSVKTEWIYQLETVYLQKKLGIFKERKNKLCLIE